MYNIKTIRGTIFCQPIGYSKEFVASLDNIVNDYLPVLVREIRDNGALQVLPIWQLSSPDEQEVIMFNGEKIDIVKVMEKEIDTNDVIAFSNRCKTVFSRILEIKGYSCSRIALAPSIIVTENGVTSVSLYNRLFRILDFQGTNLESSNLSQVYRVNQSLGTNVIIINHVVNFHAESELVSNEIRRRYIGDFDINTMDKPEYKFSIDDVKQFFDMAPSNFSLFYNLFFSK